MLSRDEAAYAFMKPKLENTVEKGSNAVLRIPQKLLGVGLEAAAVSD